MKLELESQEKFKICLDWYSYELFINNILEMNGLYF